MSDDVVPARTIQLPPRRGSAASGLIKANRESTPATPPAAPDTELTAEVVPGADLARQAPQGSDTPKRRLQATSRASQVPAGRAQVSVLIDESVRDRARAALRVATYWEEVDTFADFVEGALRREVERLEREYNEGRPIEPRSKPLSPGRKVRP